MAVTIDTSLNSFQVPALSEYVPEFGTKKSSGGLSTAEVNENIMMPFKRQRAYIISEDTETTDIEADSKFIFIDSLQDSTTLTLGDGSRGICVQVHNLSSVEQIVVASEETYSVPANSFLFFIYNTSWINEEILNKRLMLEASWPEGSLYWTSKPINPGTLLGGEWQQIVDKFILAGGDLYALNDTGGSSTVILTEDNLPSHNHTFTGTEVTTGGMSANSSGSFKATYVTFNGDQTLTGCFSSGGAAGGNIAGGGLGTAHWKINANIAHTHKVTAAGTIGNTGNGTAVDIMPPYVVKYCWERIS